MQFFHTSNCNRYTISTLETAISYNCRTPYASHSLWFTSPKLHYFTKSPIYKRNHHSFWGLTPVDTLICPPPHQNRENCSEVNSHFLESNQSPRFVSNSHVLWRHLQNQGGATSSLPVRRRIAGSGDAAPPMRTTRSLRVAFWRACPHKNQQKSSN